MAINEATLAKEVNGVKEYIYPKTKTSLVKDGDSTLDITLSTISGKITNLEGYVGGQNVSTTIESYIVSDITTTGTKVPTAATVQNITDALNTNKADTATTISGYGITDAYTKTEVDAKLSSVYKPKGSLAPSGLTASLLVAANEGFVYNISADFTTTSNFVDGAGITAPAGSNVIIKNNGTAQSPDYKFDLLAGGTVDLTNYTRFSDVESYIVSDITTTGTKVPTAAAVKSGIEGYIVTNIDTTGTKVPTAAAVKSAISNAITTTLSSASSGKAADASAVNTRFTTLEGYVGGQNVSTTVEGYIVSDITTSGTKVPTAAAVKSGIESYIVTNIDTTGTKVPTCATVKSSIEGYIVTNISTAGTKVPTAATVKTFVENHIVESTASTYSGHIYTILDASSNVLAYFDTTGGFHINGPIYATNI